MRDYWTLVRPPIMAMVLLAMAVSACVAGRQAPPWTVVAHALLGTALVIAGAMALNQRLEVRRDAAMARTAGRPLPAGRLGKRQVMLVGMLASAAGLGYLVLFAAPTLVLLAAAGWLIYVGAYTPLKSRSAWQTPVGAVAGAMPVLLGAAAAGDPWGTVALTLFGVLCFWQLPHAMAVAWRYRDQFAAAGVRLATVVDPSGRTAGIIAVLGAALLLPTSLAPPGASLAGWGYGVCALVLGLGYLGFAACFLWRRNDATARWLLRASLVYLPALLLALLL